MKAAILTAFICGLITSCFGADSNARPFMNDADQRIWLTNMVLYHQYTAGEISAASGVSMERARELVRHFEGVKLPTRSVGEPLLVLPYPGGRHPRIGFLEGAVAPQRETKLSIFTPWDEKSYIVADVPEAIWSNLGLTYLAHTHIDTIWSRQKIGLPKLEWTRLENGDYTCERTLPNGIRFGTLARSTPEAVLMKMWLSNGTMRALSDLRVQNCVMLKGAAGFQVQTNANKVSRGAFSACRSEIGDRWVITAWKPLHRAWANAPVPCVHSDPKFPELKPGEQQTIYGLVSFFVGGQVEPEFDRLDARWENWMKF